MKRIMSIVLALVLILSFLVHPVQAYASSDISIKPGGSVSQISYSQTGSSEIIRVFASSSKILGSGLTFPDGANRNYRLSFRIADVSVPLNGKLDVNKGSVLQIRYANFGDPRSVNIVVETSVKPNYSLAPSSDGKSVVLTLSSSPIPAEQTPKPGSPTSAKPTQNRAITSNGPLSWTMSGDTCVIRLEGISLSQTAAGNAPRFELREKEKLLQITIPGKDQRFRNGPLSGNSIIYGMLVNYNEKLNQTIIRVSYHNAITFTHEISGGSSVLKVKGGKANIPANSAAPTPKATPMPANTGTTAPASSQGPDIGFVFNTDSVRINASNTRGYKVYRVGNPSRVVIEMPGIAAPSDKLMTTGSLYNRAVVSQASANTVKLELYTDNMPDWTVSEGNGSITVGFVRTELTNLQAGNNDGSTALRLVSPGIVNRYRQLSDSIVPDDSVANSTFTFMLPLGIVNLGNGAANIEDGLIKSIVVLTTQQSSFLLINKKDPNKQFKIIEGKSADELLIVAATSESSTGGSLSKLVVLDPGHGGSDPGGTVGNQYEKTYNLDIALKCEAILKAKGINVLLTRYTDAFVGLEERAAFANSRNATLFVSIHNNMMPNASYKGSMTLYYPSSYDGKAYAQILQNNMTKDLGTGDLGLRARGDVTVLKKTKMPAVLAEIACMSNPDDLAMLNTEAFRQKAASSLADSIVQILNLR